MVENRRIELVIRLSTTAGVRQMLRFIVRPVWALVDQVWTQHDMWWPDPVIRDVHNAVVNARSALESLSRAMDMNGAEREVMDAQAAFCALTTLAGELVKPSQVETDFGDATAAILWLAELANERWGQYGDEAADTER